ncbi:MAG: hypothetical protein B7Y83_00080 [Flavobacteriales bacterium 32-34-25]|nr:MAG: hypothetical protein B7Y83_00080 [Flavobacteriales bacterium 32-34-25]
MLEELQLKIDLYQEQIDNLEQSGHFTEKEIEVKSIPLKAHLELLKQILNLRKFSLVANAAANRMYEFIIASETMRTPTHEKYGMTQESYDEGSKMHDKFFNPSYFIAVQQPEFLTPNQQEA